MVSQTIPSAEVEQQRQERLRKIQTESQADWEENYKPGSFGCHELLDRVSLAAASVDEHVLDHPSCVRDKEWYALADQAVTVLNELYQRIGAEHF